MDGKEEQIALRIAYDTLDELERATSKFGRFASGHEGYAIIKEELDELWDEIKDKKHTNEAMRAEAIQVAAMAIRFVMDVCTPRPDKAAAA